MTAKPIAIITADQDAVVTEIDVSAPPSRVFEALTDSRQLAQWFAGGSCPVKVWEMDARKGGSYGYTSVKSDIPSNGIDKFECHGEILEFDPPRLLVYTWIANWHINKQRKTVVRWELTPIANGTCVKVTHSALANETAAREDYRGGWPGVMQKLKEFTERA
ncbi:MAG: SRPBCC domain-containing protein [Terriglobales bacterium]